MPRHDTTELMEAIWRDAKVPVGSTYRDPAIILGMATDQMERMVVPELLKVPGNHLMTFEEQPLLPDTLRYRFPTRAIRPERLQVHDESGKMLGKLVLAAPDMVDDVLAGRCPRGNAYGYWCPENSHAVVVLQNRWQGISDTRRLRCYYRREVARLCLPAECRIVTDVIGSIVTLTTFNSDDVTEDDLSFGPWDVIHPSSPFEPVVDDVFADGTTTSSMEIYSMPTSIKRGDVFCPAGYACFPQIPKAYIGAVVAYTAARVLAADPEAKGRARADAMDVITTAQATITPRADEAETVVNNDWL